MLPMSKASTCKHSQTSPAAVQPPAAGSDNPDLAVPPAQPGELGDAELLCLFLGLDAQRDEALGLCVDALRASGGVRGLFAAAGPASRVLNGAQWRQLQAARELLQRHLRQALQRGNALSSPADTLDYLRAALRDRSREIFTCLFLDTRHRVIACEELFQGSIDGACVYPRVVAEKALRHGAAAVIIAHNHPSGVSEPSLADQAITRRLREALALLEVRLLDHFVIGDGEPVSMASRGML
jgi:DNA repair protein RadC